MELDFTPSKFAKEIGGVESSIRAIFDIPVLFEKASRKRHIRKIFIQLRTIYFPRDGSIDVLRRFSDGETITLDEFEQHSEDWIQGEDEVLRSIGILRELADLSNLELTINELNFVDKIIKHKTIIRRWINGFFQLAYSNPDTEKLKKDAKKVIEAIERLNQSIELAEQKLGTN